ncbi:MAG TPA: hypothetical protein VIN10_12635 [Bacteroidales bacterium]
MKTNLIAKKSSICSLFLLMFFASTSGLLKAQDDALLQRINYVGDSITNYLRAMNYPADCNFWTDKWSTIESDYDYSIQAEATVSRANERHIKVVLPYNDSIKVREIFCNPPFLYDNENHTWEWKTSVDISLAGIRAFDISLMGSLEKCYVYIGFNIEKSNPTITCPFYFFSWTEENKIKYDAFQEINKKAKAAELQRLKAMLAQKGIKAPFTERKNIELRRGEYYEVLTPLDKYDDQFVIVYESDMSSGIQFQQLVPYIDERIDFVDESPFDNKFYVECTNAYRPDSSVYYVTVGKDENLDFETPDYATVNILVYGRNNPNWNKLYEENRIRWEQETAANEEAKRAEQARLDQYYREVAEYKLAEEAAATKARQEAANTKQMCPYCNGTGYETRSCISCLGKGYVTNAHTHYSTTETPYNKSAYDNQGNLIGQESGVQQKEVITNNPTQDACSTCKGLGYLKTKTPCKYCGGKGYR